MKCPHVTSGEPCTICRCLIDARDALAQIEGTARKMDGYGSTSSLKMAGVMIANFARLTARSIDRCTMHLEENIDD